MLSNQKETRSIREVEDECLIFSPYANNTPLCYLKRGGGADLCLVSQGVLLSRDTGLPCKETRQVNEITDWITMGVSLDVRGVGQGLGVEKAERETL